MIFVVDMKEYFYLFVYIK